MKKLRMISIVLLLAGAVALTGCSRDAVAHKGRGNSENSEVAIRGQGGGAQGDGGWNAASQESGRMVVEKGGLSDLTGTLKQDGSEWYLDTGDATYILHFGNSSYVDSTGLQLHAEDPIEIRGFVSEEDIAVVTAVYDSRSFEFRREDGTPLWAGRGRRSGIARQSETGSSGDETRSGKGGKGRSRI